MNAAAWFQGPAGTLAFLLLAGHVLGDFYLPPDDRLTLDNLLQPENSAAAKRRHPSPGARFRHAVLVAAATGAVLVLFAPWPVTAAAVAVTLLTHFGIDLAAERAESGGFGPLATFVWEQAAHLLVIVTFVRVVASVAPGFPAAGSEADLLPGGIVPLSAAWLHQGRGFLAALVYWCLGVELVRRFLETFPAMAPPGRQVSAAGGSARPGITEEAPPGPGWARVEKWTLAASWGLVFLFASTGSWGGVAMVLVAEWLVAFLRFRDARQLRAYTERFLVSAAARLLATLAAAWIAG